MIGRGRRRLLAGVLIVGWAPASVTLAQSARVIGLLLSTEPAEATAQRQGALVALEQVNRTSQPPARLMVRGRLGQWGAEGEEAALLALDDGARGLITPAGGSAAHLTLQVAGRTSVPVISLCPDSSVTTAGIPWVLRMAPRSIEQAETIFLGLRTNAGRPSTWSALVADGRAGREAAKDLKEAAGRTGVRLVDVLEVSTNALAWPGMAEGVRRGSPEGVLLWLEPARASGFAQALRRAKFPGYLAGPAVLASTVFIAEAGGAAEGLVAPAFVAESPEIARAFQAEYSRRFGVAPDPTATLSYDAARLLLELMDRAGPEPPRRLFPLGWSLKGASGPLTFDRQGNRVARLCLLQCRAGSFQPFSTKPSPEPKL